MLYRVFLYSHCSSEKCCLALKRSKLIKITSEIWIFQRNATYLFNWTSVRFASKCSRGSVLVNLCTKPLVGVINRAKLIFVSIPLIMNVWFQNCYSADWNTQIIYENIWRPFLQCPQIRIKKNAFSRIGARLRNEKPRDLRELTKVFNSYKALFKPIRILLSPWRFLSEFKNFQIELVCPHASDGIQIYQSLVRPTRLWAAEIQARFAFHTLSDSSWIYFLPLCRVI